MHLSGINSAMHQTGFERLHRKFNPRIRDTSFNLCLFLRFYSSTTIINQKKTHEAQTQSNFKYKNAIKNRNKFNSNNTLHLINKKNEFAIIYKNNFM